MLKSAEMPREFLWGLLTKEPLHPSDFFLLVSFTAMGQSLFDHVASLGSTEDISFCNDVTGISWYLPWRLATLVISAEGIQLKYSPVIENRKSLLQNKVRHLQRARMDNDQQDFCAGSHFRQASITLSRTDGFPKENFPF